MTFRFRPGCDRKPLQEREFRKPARDAPWKPRLLGILLSVVSMHVLVVRPLLSRVDQLECELHLVDLTLTELAGSRDGLWQTNDLLTALRLQGEELAAARATVQQWHQLSEEIERESARLPSARRALARMARSPADEERPLPGNPPPDRAAPSSGGPVPTVAASPPVASPPVLVNPSAGGWQMEIRPASEGDGDDVPEQLPLVHESTPPSPLPVKLADWFAASQMR